MGNVLTLKKEKLATLLQPAIAGDINEIKAQIGHHIASINLKTKEELAAFVDQGDNEGNTALIGAVFSGHLDIAKFLIETCHATLSIENNIGCSAFWVACGYGHAHVVEYMIQRMDAIESTDLVEACTKGNSSGDTPFLAASSKKHCEVMDLLLLALNEGAWDILMKTNVAGDTPLQVAVGMGDGEVVKLLLDHEEKMLDLNDGSTTRPLHLKNAKGLAPLLVACERNFANIVEELITRGADLSTTDENGRSPIAIASFCGCMDVMDYLLSNKDACKSLLNKRDTNGCTPFWLAARTGNLKMVQCLIAAGADKSLPDNEGSSPEAVAVKFKKDQVVEYLKIS